ncbi:MAG TPA: nicotinate-nucleotide--dimethylbenzimidazole phosphoribosyltransferase, partial [Nitrospira sp.]|nr:nicotinate-nucleotide--dimethylbenzimidazole phosphoribosyltransferase [Nitrospira sp.]
MSLTEVLNQICDVDMEVAARTQRRLDRLTKPQGSLGRLEQLAVQYCAITSEAKPAVPRGRIYTFAADHGVVDEGVSAYPRDVTAQMVLNFLRGGAGVNVLARHAGVEVRVVDIGVAHDFGSVAGLINRKLLMGTRNMAQGEAMHRRTVQEALAIGIELASEAVKEGVTLIGTGEMGIGNTTASAAITAV